MFHCAYRLMFSPFSNAFNGSQGFLIPINHLVVTARGINAKAQRLAVCFLLVYRFEVLCEHPSSVAQPSDFFNDAPITLSL